MTPTPPKILVDDRSKKGGAVPLIGFPEKAWGAVAWFGLLLAVVGLGDFAIAFYPPKFGTVEWEFGTVASTFAGLPLVTMGLAALLAAALWKGSRWQIIVIAVGLILLAVAILGAYLMFLTDVPVALRAVPQEVKVGIKKAVVKTSLLGVTFAGAYLVAGIGSLVYLRRASRAR